MNTDQIVKSWKDQHYSHALSTAEQTLLPENPAGLMELSDEEIMGVSGGNWVNSVVLTVTIAIIIMG